MSIKALVGSGLAVAAIAPGYTASETSIAWLRPRLASHGFVVISINTNSRYDQPSARGD